MATQNNEMLVVTAILALSLTNTILLFVSMRGTEWVAYKGGHDGLWDVCNITVTENSTDSDEGNCVNIPMNEASGYLHGVRAFMVIGFIFWCLGLIQRYMTWQHRGTEVDKQTIFAAFSTAVFISAAAFTFTYGYFETEYANNKEYTKPNFDVHHAFCFIVAALSVIIGILHIKHHRILNSSSSSIDWSKCFPRLNPCCKRWRCCGKRVVLPQSTRQQTSMDCRNQTRRQNAGQSAPDISVISTDNHDGPPNYNSLTHSPSYLRDLGLANSSGHSDLHDVSIETLSGAPETTDETARRLGHGGSRNVLPLDILTLPPAYNDVVGDDNDVTSDPPPPTYYEATNNRDLILSPPPEYQETNT